MNFKYDVVIPVRNGSKYIIKAVESCLSQTEKPCHVIVVENNSSDDTLKKVTSYVMNNSLDSKVIIIATKQEGVSRARNLGVSNCDSEVIAFLDADDFWEPNKMHLQLPLLTKFSLVHTGSFVVDEEENFVRSENPVDTDSQSAIFELDYPVTGSASSVICLKSEFNQAGGFDDNLDLAEDLDLWIRLGKIRGFGSVNKELVSLRLHENRSQSASASYEYKKKEFISLFYVLSKNTSLYPSVKSPWLRVLNWYFLDTKFSPRFLWYVIHGYKNVFPENQLNLLNILNLYFQTLYDLVLRKYVILRLMRKTLIKGWIIVRKIYVFIMRSLNLKN